MRHRYVGLGIIISIFLTGCGQDSTNAVISIEKPVYQNISYETTIVEKGDLEPITTLTLSPEVVEKIDYTVSEENLEVDQIFVSAGERVTKGQVMVTFKAEDIRKKMDEYQDEVEKNQLLLNHYTRLAEVDKKGDYKVEIQKLTDNVELSKLFLDEERERLNNCNLIAKQSGTISYISSALMDGYVATAACLVTEMCGQETYYTETDVINQIK